MESQIHSSHSSIQLYALSDLFKKVKKSNSLSIEECQILVQCLFGGGGGDGNGNGNGGSNRRLLASQIILEGIQRRVCSRKELDVLGMEALLRKVGMLDQEEILSVHVGLLLLHKIYSITSTATTTTTDALSSSSKHSKSSGGGGKEEHPFIRLARSCPHVMGSLMDVAFELYAIDDEKDDNGEGVGLEGFFTLILEGGSTDDPNSKSSTSSNEACIMRLVAFAAKSMVSSTSLCFRKSCKRRIWWDLLVKALLLQVPRPASPLQSFILWQMAGLVEKGRTTLEILRLGEWRELCHLLTARIVFIWTNKQILEGGAFDVLFKLVACGPQVDILTLRCLVLSFSFVMLDFVAEERLQKMLVHLCKVYSSLYPTDGWIKVVVLPLLSCLAQGSLVRVDQGIHDFFQVIESLFECNAVAVVASDDTFLPSEYNPFYGCIIQCCIEGQEKMVKYYHDVSILPGLRSLFVAFNLFSNSDNGSHALATLKSLQQENLDRFIRKQDLLTFLYLYLFLINKKRFSINRILIENIPALTRANDVFVTSSCLKVISTILQPRQETSMLDITGFRALLQMLAIQRRLFPQVKLYIAGWVNRFKRSEGAGRMKSKRGIQRENDLEVLVTAAIRDLCKQDAHNFGKELLPIIISLLKLSDKPDFGSTRSASSVGTGNLLAAFNACVEGEVTSPRTAWNVLFKSYYEALNEDSMPIIPASLCDFFALLAAMTNEAVEKEIEFRQEILNKYLAPLLSHKDSLVRERAFKSLIYFPFAEEASAFIAPPLELIAQIEANQLPQTVSDFLVARIKSEVRGMPRPVFKGLSVESGVSLRGLAPEGKSAAGGFAADVAKMQSLAKRLTNLWKGGHKNRAGLGPAVLFNPFYADSTPQEGFRNLASLAMRDITTSLASPLQLLDISHAWQSFTLSSLNAILQAYTVDSSEDEKSVFLKSFVEGEVQYFFGVAESSTVPSSVAASITIATSLMTSAAALHFLPAFESITNLTGKLEALLYDNGQRISREVESVVILCLVDLLDLLHNDEESENVFVKLWSLCLQDEREDEFIFGYCGGKLVLREMSSSCSPKIAEVFLEEFLARFFDEQEVGWKSFGAAYSFATILANPLVDLDEFIDDERLQLVIHHCYAYLQEMNASGNHQAAAVVLSAGWTHLKPGMSKEKVLGVLSDVYARSKENSILYSCCSRLQISDSQDAAVLMMKNLIECIKLGASPSMITCSFDALRTLVGRDLQGKQSSKLPKELLWEIVACCENEVLNNATPIIVRASGWCLGFVLSALITICNGAAGGGSSGMDPKDYRRLNGESSYLKASFDALKAGSAPYVKKLLFEEVFLELENCILPPVDWRDVWDSVKGCIGDGNRDEALLCFLAFASAQACDKSSKYLVSFVLETIQNCIAASHTNPHLAEFMVSKRGFGKLLELAGVGTKSYSASISASALQSVLLNALRTFSSSNFPYPFYLLGLIRLVRESIRKSLRISGALSSDSKIIADLQKLLWSWLVDPSSNREVQTDFDFEVVYSVVSCCEGASPELLDEILVFTTETKVARTSLCLGGLGSLALIKPVHLTLFLNEALSRARSSQNHAMEAVFILNWLVATFSNCEERVEDKLSLVSKVLDIFVLSIDDSYVSNLSQFVWKYFVLPTTYTLLTGKKTNPVTRLDWTLIETQGCLGIFQLLAKLPSTSKLYGQMASRLIKVRDTLSIDHDGSLSILLKVYGHAK